MAEFSAIAMPSPGAVHAFGLGRPSFGWQQSSWDCSSRMALRWSWKDGWGLDMDEVLETDLAYFKDDAIWCKDGLKSFPRERLNDNFCDCADGTDEPGTSACPNSKYYCKNVGSAPKLVYSSRVNDGICDCCDGSDEYEKRVDCANTCGGAIKELSERLEEDLGQSTTFDADDVSEAIPDKEQKKFGEDLVSKLKELKAVMLVMQWLPLFSLLSLFGWMWARVPRRLPLRQKKVSRPSLV